MTKFNTGILVLLIILNLILLWTASHRDRMKVALSDQVDRINLAFAILVGFCAGIAVGGHWHESISMFARGWGVHIGLTLTALGFGVSSFRKRP
jgi:hypothetical protein